MSKKINLDALPEGKFDLPIIGMNLDKASVKKITDSWTDTNFERLEKLGYGHLVISDTTTAAPPSSKTGGQEDAKK